MKRGQVMALAVALFATGAVAGAADLALDWPRWRGPDGDSISKDAAWNPMALTGGAKIAWTAQVGAGYAGVAVKGERLYTMGQTQGIDAVRCLNARTGQEIWKHDYPTVRSTYPGPRATPLADSEGVYVVGREGHVMCLDTEQGTVKWEVNIAKEYGAVLPTWGHAGSPAVLGNLLILNACRSGLAMDKKTGRKVWATEPGPCGYATPVFMGSAAQREALFLGSKALYAVDASTGRELWSFPWETHADVNAADPLVTKSGILISSGYEKGSVLLAIDGAVAKPVWQSASLRSQFASPICLGGYIYGIDGQTGSGGLGIVCLDANTGARKWNRQIGFGAMSAAGDKLIVLTEKGDLIIAAASPAGYQEIARAAKVVSNPKCWTMPVLCKGLIYCRNLSGELVAVDVR